MNKNYMRAIPREWRNISKVYAALGDEHRQRILLTFEPGERLCIGEIVEVSSRTIRHVAFNVRATLQVEGQEQCAVFWLPRVEKNLTRVQMCSIHRLFAVGERLPE